MITDQQFADWAQSPTKHPVILIEMNHRDGTVYLSNSTYATGQNETPANISYDVCLKQEIFIDRTLDEDSVFALRIYNDGSLKNWIDYFWVDEIIEIFIGDKNWPRADFKRLYKGEIESFTELNPSSYEVKSTLASAVVDTQLNHVNNIFFYGNHTRTRARYVGQTFGLKRFRVANTVDFNRQDVVAYYASSQTPTPITWWDDGYFNNNTFSLDNYSSADPTKVYFECPSLNPPDFKTLFTDVCNYAGQAYNADNLANFPFNPDVTFYLSENMTFTQFLDLTCQAVGALYWINDAGELELYRKDLPELAGNEDRVTSWITQSDNPTIKTITTEYPASLVQSRNPDSNPLVISAGPYHYAYNTLDPGYPSRSVVNYTYLEDSEAIDEGRRFADLLSVTRRTYSVTINRISPELFIGAIVNIHSPKDRWEESGAGLNALVVGFTQSFKSNKSELIVWR